MQQIIVKKFPFHSYIEADIGSLEICPPNLNICSCARLPAHLYAPPRCYLPDPLPEVQRTRKASRTTGQAAPPGRSLGRAMLAVSKPESVPFPLCQLLPPAPDIGSPMLPPPCAMSGHEQVQQNTRAVAIIRSPRRRSRAAKAVQ